MELGSNAAPLIFGFRGDGTAPRRLNEARTLASLPAVLSLNLSPHKKLFQNELDKDQELHFVLDYH